MRTVDWPNFNIRLFLFVRGLLLFREGASTAELLPLALRFPCFKATVPLLGPVCKA